MSDKAWKRTERRIAALLGGQRIPVNGRGDQPDIEHAWLAVECKHRQTTPQWLQKALRQARTRSRDVQCPSR